MKSCKLCCLTGRERQVQPSALHSVRDGMPQAVREMILCEFSCAQDSTNHSVRNYLLHARMDLNTVVGARVGSTLGDTVNVLA